MNKIKSCIESRRQMRRAQGIVDAIAKVSNQPIASEVLKHYTKMLSSLDQSTLSEIKAFSAQPADSFRAFADGLSEFLLQDLTDAIPLYVRHYECHFSNNVWAAAWQGTIAPSSFIQVFLLEQYKLGELDISPEQESDIIRVIIYLAQYDVRAGSWLAQCLLDHPDDHQRIQQILLGRYVADRASMEALLNTSVPLSISDGTL